MRKTKRRITLLIVILLGIWGWRTYTKLQQRDAPATAVSSEAELAGQVAEELGGETSLSVFSEMEALLGNTAELSDSELEAKIRDIAARHSVKLTETQVRQLTDLCRGAEKLNPEQLKQRVEEIRSTVRKISEAGSRAGEYLETAKDFLETLKELFGVFQNGRGTEQ